MNKDMMKKNVGVHVHLQPPAIHLDHHGFEPRPAADDDWWLIGNVTDDGVTVSNPRTGHFRLLGYDHIQKFTSDGTKSGARRGFLTLLVQLYVQGDEVRVLPTRPGEPLPPKHPQVADRLVGFNYAQESGIQQRLATQGYIVSWCRSDQLAGLVLQGAERVIERDVDGVHSIFHLRDGLVLIKRRAW